MSRGAHEFWSELERRFPEEARGKEEEVARYVLCLLRQRIRPEKAQHLKAALPDEVKALWTAPRVGVAEEHTARRIVELDHNEFVSRVRLHADLPNMQHAARATAAVFAAMRRLLPAQEADDVEDQLPDGLKQLWRGDHSEKPGPHDERGPGPFWVVLSDRLEGRVDASASDITRVVLDRLRARVTPEIARQVEAGLPRDLLACWLEGPTPVGAESEELPERFFGRIAARLALPDTDQARHATAAVFGAFRRTLPPDLAERVEEALPDALRGYWRGM